MSTIWLPHNNWKYHSFQRCGRIKLSVAKITLEAKKGMLSLFQLSQDFFFAANAIQKHCMYYKIRAVPFSV